MDNIYEEEFPTITPEDLAQYAIWEYEDSYRDEFWMDGEDYCL